MRLEKSETPQKLPAVSPLVAENPNINSLAFKVSLLTRMSMIQKTGVLFI